MSKRICTLAHKQGGKVPCVCTVYGIHRRRHLDGRAIVVSFLLVPAALFCLEGMHMNAGSFLLSLSVFIGVCIDAPQK